MMEALNQPSSTGGNRRDNVNIQESSNQSRNSSYNSDDNEANVGELSEEHASKSKNLFFTNNKKSSLENGDDFHKSCEQHESVYANDCDLFLKNQTLNIKTLTNNAANNEELNNERYEATIANKIDSNVPNLSNDSTFGSVEKEVNSNNYNHISNTQSENPNDTIESTEFYKNVTAIISTSNDLHKNESLVKCETNNLSTAPFLKQNQNEDFAINTNNIRFDEKFSDDNNVDNSLSIGNKTDDYSKSYSTEAEKKSTQIYNKLDYVVHDTTNKTDSSNGNAEIKNSEYCFSNDRVSDLIIKQKLSNSFNRLSNDCDLENSSKENKHSVLETKNSLANNCRTSYSYDSSIISLNSKSFNVANDKSASSNHLSIETNDCHHDLSDISKSAFKRERTLSNSSISNSSQVSKSSPYKPISKVNGEHGDNTNTLRNLTDRINNSFVENYNTDCCTDDLNTNLISNEDAMGRDTQNYVHMVDVNEASRSSMLSSCKSTDSSSSHQLVIDQQLDDQDVELVQPISPENELQQPPIKLTIKRKASSGSSNTEKENQPKKKFLIENSRNEAIDLTCNDRYKTEIALVKPTDLSQDVSPSTVLKKSILLQQLEKPCLDTITTRKTLFQTPEVALRTLANPTFTSMSCSSVVPTADNTKLDLLNTKTGELSTIAELSTHRSIFRSNLNLDVFSTKPQTECSYQEDFIQPEINEPVLKCTICKSVYIRWKMFVHMREKHKKFYCVYCTKTYITVEKLAMHLENKHDMEQNHFSSDEVLKQSIVKSDGQPIDEFLLVCCTCQYMFKSTDIYTEHDCTNYLKPAGVYENMVQNLKNTQIQPEEQSNLHNISSKTNILENPHASVSKFSVNTPVSPVKIVSNEINSYPPLPMLVSERLQHSHQQDSPIGLISNDIKARLEPPLQINCHNSQIQLTDGTQSHISEDTDIDIDKAQLSHLSTFEINSPIQNSSKSNIELLPPPPLLNVQDQLIVPKIKLRVPKEFQKSVDDAISSMESEEEEEVEGDSSEKSVAQISELSNNSPTAGTSDFIPSLDYDSNTLTAAEVTLSQDDNDKNMSLADDEDSPDETSAQMMLLQQEIERTKQNIERRKHKQQMRKLANQNKLESPPCSSEFLKEPHWVPTPPLSPHSSRLITQKDELKTTDSTTEIQLSGEQIPPQQLTPPHRLRDRKCSQGSEIMEIDETITKREVISISTANALKDPTSLDDRNNNVDTRNSETTAEPTSLTISVDLECIEKETILSELSISSSSSENNESQEIDVCNTALDDECKDVSDPEKMMSGDGIELANEDVMPVELKLSEPLSKINSISFLRICLLAVHSICLYCNYARRIAVNGKSLALHMLAQHRFTAVVDSITAEELKTEKIVDKLKSLLPLLESEYLNSSNYCTYEDGEHSTSFNERTFECFQCRYATSTYKELYMHNRKNHNKSAILCFMCRTNFFSFSEILCHICPGASNKLAPLDMKYRCCLCDLNNIPSAFRLIVHLRKKHVSCDVCLEDCKDQSKLASHVWKHKLNHFCYRCSIAYRSKVDITRHLFWKHGTESIICKRCLQKRWRHVYHFCAPPSEFICEICNMSFSKSLYLNVHRRIHLNQFPYQCDNENCCERFVSKRLMLKHIPIHNPPLELIEQKSDVGDKLEENCYQNEKSMFKQEDGSTYNSVGVPNNELKDEPKQEEANNTTIELNSVNEKDETEVPHKKRKKNKRSKESIADLNLVVPNLSESDSSNESERDNQIPAKKFDITSVPQPMLSPLSDADNASSEENVTKKIADTGNALEIWKNFMESQHENEKSAALGVALKRLRNESECSDQGYPIAGQPIAVTVSDHDYCSLLKAQKNLPLQNEKTPINSPMNISFSTPYQRKNSKVHRRSGRNSDESSSSDSSSSDSSCSCQSSCSCTSNTSQTSSSSSSDDSDSSKGSRSSSGKHYRKKSERDRLSRKSESISPKKSYNGFELINEEDKGNKHKLNEVEEPNESPAPNIVFLETDLWTTDSDTDEDFYDKNPQKLNMELLEKARVRFINETLNVTDTSVPMKHEGVTNFTDDPTFGKRIKMKKKKRERKSASQTINTEAPALNIITMTEVEGTASTISQCNTPITKETAENLITKELEIPTNHQKSKNKTREQRILEALSTPLYKSYSVFGLACHQTPVTPSPSQLIAKHIGLKRESEGSSCSDADAALKRSKRSRRRNRFYGYSSEEDNSTNNLRKGTHPYQPQSPPQLTWHKEDLPTPSRSILKNKPARLSNLLVNKSSLKKRNSYPDSEKTSRKRKKKNQMPIPTLKIPMTQLNHDTGTTTIPVFAVPDQPQKQSLPYNFTTNKDLTITNASYNNSDESSTDEGTSQVPQKYITQTTSMLTSVGPPKPPNPMFRTAQQELPRAPPPPPTPEAKAFRHKIPPALLPNPDLLTLQYFKANNIRYPIKPPAGARQAREGEAVYCYCRCPYDEVSEMIACDGASCLIEWFHFECVGIMVAPQGKWFCAECRPQYSEELYKKTSM